MITKPEDPKREGYQFLGWYKDINGTEVFDFDDENNKTIVDAKIYAKWDNV